MTFGEILAVIAGAVAGLVGVALAVLLTLVWPAAFVIGCYFIGKGLMS